MAKSYLAYVDCSRPGGAKMTIACAFTAGDGDNLFAGRNGIFYDRKGRDWNATIARIVDNRSASTSVLGPVQEDHALDRGADRQACCRGVTKPRPRNCRARPRLPALLPRPLKPRR
jgi:hypothetical protein